MNWGGGAALSTMFFVKSHVGLELQARQGARPGPAGGSRSGPSQPPPCQPQDSQPHRQAVATKTAPPLGPGRGRGGGP